MATNTTVEANVAAAVDNDVQKIKIIAAGPSECFLIRNLLTLEDQAQLLEYIQERDKTPRDEQGKIKATAMVPSPKTLLLGTDGHPSIRYAFGEASVVNDMVEKGGKAFKAENLNVAGRFNLCEYKELSMATIEYEAPDGHFPPHVDHCNDSFVFLTSLGCTANFMVKTPTMANQYHYKFHSGDLLVFNASSKASILHSVVSIEPKSSPIPALPNQRYGVQCRVYF